MDVMGAASISCPECYHLRRKMEELQRQHCTDYLLLKKRIISTSSIIKKYKSANEEKDALTKQCDKLKDLVKQLQSDCKKYEKDLAENIEMMDPLKKENEMMKRTEEETLKKFTKLSCQHEATEKFIEQLQACIKENERSERKFTKEIIDIKAKTRHDNYEINKKIKEYEKIFPTLMKYVNKSCKLFDKKELIKAGSKMSKLVNDVKKLVYHHDFPDDTDSEYDSFNEEDDEPSKLMLENLLLNQRAAETTFHLSKDPINFKIEIVHDKDPETFTQFKDEINAKSHIEDVELITSSSSECEQDTGTCNSERRVTRSLASVQSKPERSTRKSKLTTAKNAGMKPLKVSPPKKVKLSKQKPKTESSTLLPKSCKGNKSIIDSPEENEAPLQKSDSSVMNAFTDVINEQSSKKRLPSVNIIDRSKTLTTSMESSHQWPDQNMDEMNESVNYKPELPKSSSTKEQLCIDQMQKSREKTDDIEFNANSLITDISLVSPLKSSCVSESVCEGSIVKNTQLDKSESSIGIVNTLVDVMESNLEKKVPVSSVTDSDESKGKCLNILNGHHNDSKDIYNENSTIAMPNDETLDSMDDDVARPQRRLRCTKQKCAVDEHSHNPNSSVDSSLMKNSAGNSLNAQQISPQNSSSLNVNDSIHNKAHIDVKQHGNKLTKEFGNLLTELCTEEKVLCTINSSVPISDEQYSDSLINDNEGLVTSVESSPISSDKIADEMIHSANDEPNQTATMPHYNLRRKQKDKSKHQGGERNIDSAINDNVALVSDGQQIEESPVLKTQFNESSHDDSTNNEAQFHTKECSCDPIVETSVDTIDSETPTNDSSMIMKQTSHESKNDSFEVSGEDSQSSTIELSSKSLSDESFVNKDVSTTDKMNSDMSSDVKPSGSDHLLRRNKCNDEDYKLVTKLDINDENSEIDTDCIKHTNENDSKNCHQQGNVSVDFEMATLKKLNKKPRDTKCETEVNDDINFPVASCSSDATSSLGNSEDGVENLGVFEQLEPKAKCTSNSNNSTCGKWNAKILKQKGKLTNIIAAPSWHQNLPVVQKSRDIKIHKSSMRSSTRIKLLKKKVNAEDILRIMQLPEQFTRPISPLTDLQSHRKSENAAPDTLISSIQTDITDKILFGESSEDEKLGDDTADSNENHKFLRQCSVGFEVSDKS